ncbi:fat body protein 1 [Haematobia irritans]|uniref:fat body protein 1 n=1 Tax=Haematobia irritans TaxID=7368 RepID=UPI003F4FD3AB
MRHILAILCLVGLATSAVLIDRTGLNINSMEANKNGVRRLSTMTKEELLRQKFILDILHQVEMPLQNPAWLQVRMEDVTDETMYMGPLDEDMKVMLDLIRSNRVLASHEMCSLNHEEHVRQLLGLYRLFVRCRNFEMVQRLAIFARRNINPVLFVNALTLAMEDRADSRMLIMPAIYEILPRLYNDDAVLRLVENVQRDMVVNGNVASMRPNILDVIDMGRRAKIMKSQMSQMGGGGMIDKTKLWMPWRNMRLQLALQKSLGGRVLMPTNPTDETIDTVQVRRITLGTDGEGKRMDLLPNDMGLRAWLNILLDELIVEQNSMSHDTMGGRWHKPTIGNVNMDERMPTNPHMEMPVNDMDMMQMNVDQRVMDEKRMNIQMDNMDRMKTMNVDRNRVMDMDNLETTSGRRTDWNRESLMWPSKREWMNAIDKDQERNMPNRNNIPLNRDIMEDRQTRIIDAERSLNTNEMREINRRIMDENRRGSTDEDDWMNARMTPNMMPRKRLDEDLPVTSIDSDRLLHVGGRRLHLLHSDVMGKQNRNPIEMKDNVERDETRRPWVIRENVMEDSNPNKDSGRRVRLIHADLRGKEGMGMEGTNSNQRRPWEIQEDTNVPIDNEWQATPMENKRSPSFGGRRLHLIHGDLNGKENIDLSQINRQTVNTMNRRDMNRMTTTMQGNDDDMPIWWENKREAHRIPRSVSSMLGENRKTRVGRMILNMMQELVARLNIEQMSLQQDMTMKTKKIGIPMMVNDMSDVRMMVLNDIRINEQSRRVIVEKMDEISQRLEQSMQIAIEHLSNKQSYYNRMNQDMDETVIQHIDQIAMTEILQEIMALSEYVEGGQMSNILENSVTQLLLRHIVNTVEQQMEKLQGEHKVEDIVMNSVHINNVKVDKLQTLVENVDVDMTNMLATNPKNIGMDKTIQTILGRVPRLNHKPFTITVDITSDRPQRAMIRTLLGPKTDIMGNNMPLEQLRQNFMLLDIANVELKQGRNTLKLKSRDITWTGRDVTPYSEMYQRVMQTLRGEMDWMSDVIIGQTNMMPHRLLLPRGRVGGLPMQLMVVVTPEISEISHDLANLRMNMDTLITNNAVSMRYPMDRKIDNMREMLMLPNVCVTDVMIHHEN